MNVQAKHATYRPPSGAHRWLSCSASAFIVSLYPNPPSEASLKGDKGHDLLATAVEWGVVPDTFDVDLQYQVKMAHEHVQARLRELGKGAQLFTEVQLDIPETGEFGTADLIYLTDSTLEIEDFKTGYVPVEVKMNPQLMCYLLGAIAKWGERKHYRIGIIQPNYVHRDGMIRHYDVTQEDVIWFRQEVNYAMTKNEFGPGKHCRDSYCPHRGSCAAFLAWSQENLALAWYPGELGGMDDETLGRAMDQADILQGWRDALRGEALRRIVHQGRAIPGYKVVKGRKDRDFANEQSRDQVYQSLIDLGASPDALYDKTPISVAGVERILKRLYSNQSHGRGAWLKMREHIMPPALLTPPVSSLTVEKEIDGRKAFKRGDEFGPILPDVL